MVTTAKDITPNFDGNEDFVLSIIAFLKDIGWVKEEQRDEYIITDKGAKELYSMPV